MAREAVIRAISLTKRYGSLVAVDQLTLEVYEGEAFSLLGPNGAGKTTTVEMLEGLRRPSSGEGYVLGYDVSDDDDVRQLKRQIGVLPQEFSTFERLTVKENLELMSALYGTSDRVNHYLEALGLWEYRNVHFGRLSGGLKRRVGIAMALVGEPKLVFLDEPTTGLDPYARREMWKFIRLLKEEGRTVFLTTHYLEEVERLCDRAAIMLRGKVLALDTVSQLVALYGGGVRLVLREAPEGLGQLLAEQGFKVNRSSAGELVVGDLNYEQAARALTLLEKAGYRGTAELTYGGLEEAFLRLTGARLTETGELA
jgi:ABC-2 type transport system ATP-binding protein